jgi:hypothetical protein
VSRTLIHDAVIHPAGEGWVPRCGARETDRGPGWTPIVTRRPLDITCPDCGKQRALAHPVESVVLPPGLGDAIDAAIADGSIFSASSRDTIDLGVAWEALTEEERAAIREQAVFTEDTQRDAVVADTQQALDDDTLVFAESLITTPHAVGYQYPELTAHVIDSAVARLQDRITRDGYTPTGGITVRIYVEQMGTP